MNVPNFIEFNKTEAEKWVNEGLKEGDDFIEELTFKFQVATQKMQNNMSEENIYKMSNLLLLMYVLSEVD